MPVFNGTSAADDITGTVGKDTISGSDGDDVLGGDAGDDSLDGGAGNDVLDGGDDHDVVNGQDGDDTIYGISDDAVDGGEGTDEFDYLGYEDATIDLEHGTGPSGIVLTNVENVVGGGGNDTILGSSAANRLDGSSGDDTISGADGADTLLGQGGFDEMSGGDGDDSLEGSFGDDKLSGDAGSDTLDGGAGNDALDGGAGLDVAVFSGNFEDYDIAYRTDPDTGAAIAVTVSDRRPDADGTDTIALDGNGKPTVELLRFADGDVDTICFMPGTLVATPSGEALVETLKRGDLVLTASGQAAPVVWMGRQTVALRFADPVKVLPVRIAAGALGRGLPKRDLLVSPDHALFLDGVLVQAGALVNGSTIRREWDVPGRWTYWHVELADHALVLAEGVPAETFVDNADRLAFDNWAEHEALHPEGRAIAEMALPRAKSARQVPQALRDRLAAVAREAAPPVPTAA